MHIVNALSEGEIIREWNLVNSHLNNLAATEVALLYCDLTLGLSS